MNRPVPFYTDVHAGLATLGTLKTQTGTFRHGVAGQGEIYSSQENRLMWRRGEKV